MQMNDIFSMSVVHATRTGGANLLVSVISAAVIYSLTATRNKVMDAVLLFINFLNNC